jgi:hypothetical protein
MDDFGRNLCKNKVFEISSKWLKSHIFQKMGKSIFVESFYGGVLDTGIFERIRSAP